ncbi:MAG: hypothetical protein ABL973_04135, partial [Micropepsaceae bacterium]
MTVAEGAPFPAENFVSEGLLKLSGSDALGPNPWTREKPVASDFNLTDGDFADGKIEEDQEASRSELVEFPWRLTSAFLLPVCAVVALYAYQVGNFAFLDPANFGRTDILPPMFWITYLGASLAIAALAAHAQTLVHVRASRKHDKCNKVVKQKQAFAAAKDEWYNDLK